MMPDDLQLYEFANIALTWIGFGTVIGLAAKIVLPRRHPGGSLAMILMGIVGTMIGWAVLQFLYPHHLVAPISSQGLTVGTAGAVLMLASYQVLGGFWFPERNRRPDRPSRRRRRRFRTAVFED